jgi:hypothetical protein
MLSGVTFCSEYSEDEYYNPNYFVFQDNWNLFSGDADILGE